MSRQVEFLLGNEAILAGAMAAGADFFAGYPITPSSEIAELASRRLPAAGGTYLQMEDEIASLGAVIGASLTGARAFTATSGPGFSLMQEHLGLGYMAEVPFVVVNVQRSGPSTGLATRPAQADVMQAKWGSHGDYQPVVLCPSTVDQCYRLTHAAFAIAERLRMPVCLLSDEIIGHLRERVETGGLEAVSRPVPDCAPAEYLPYRPGPDGVPPLAAFGSGYVFHVTGSMHDETGFPSADPGNAGRVIRRLSDKVLGFRDELSGFCRVHAFSSGGERAQLTMIAYGASARSAREAARQLAANKVAVSVVVLHCLWPFLAEVVRRHASGPVLVPEMNLGQLVGEVERALPGHHVIPVNRSDGEPLPPADILAAAKEVLR